MKKSVIALIVAAVLIVTGGILLFLGLRSIDFDRAEKPVNKVYTADGSFQNIQIDTGICDVRFFQTDGDLTVHCPKTEKLEYVVLVEDDVLRISAMDIRKWYDFIGINFAETEITVYLPETQYESLHIQTATGDIQIPQDFTFDTAELSTSTGDMDFAAAVTENLVTKTSTGKTSISGTSPAYLECRSSTGRIELDAIQSVGTVNLRASTGRIFVKDVSCENLTTQSSTGNTQLENVLVNERMQLTTTTGQVEIKDCDAGTAIIETDTGDVEGNFLTPKWFVTDTDTGDIRVPSSREGGECRITTDTGDIEFY